MQQQTGQALNRLSIHPYLVGSLHLKSASGVNARAIQAEIPQSNVGELSIGVQEGRVRSDVADVGPEGSEVAVPVHMLVVVQILLRLLVKLLGFVEVPMGIGILGDPNSRIGEPAIQEVSKCIL